VCRLAFADLDLQVHAVGRIGYDLVLDDIGLVEAVRDVEPFDALEIGLPGDRVVVALARQGPPSGIGGQDLVFNLARRDLVVTRDLQVAYDGAGLLLL